MGITLDEAIKAHIRKKRKYLHPEYSEALVRDTQLHIKTIEQAPKDPKLIEARILKKKEEKSRLVDVMKRDDLSSEIEALQILRSMIRMEENGQSLDQQWLASWTVIIMSRKPLVVHSMSQR